MRVKSYIVRLLCMSSLVCLSIGPVALLYISAALIRSHDSLQLYEPAPCDVINMTSVNHTCRCGNQSHGCNMKQHCVEVKVRTKVNTVLLRHSPPSSSDVDSMGNNYTLCTVTACEEESSNISFPLKNSLHYQCTTGPCDPKTANETQPTMDELLNKVTNVSPVQNLTCFVNPNDTGHALWRLGEKQRKLTGIVWPLVIIAVGLIFSVLARVCTQGKD